MNERNILRALGGIRLGVGASLVSAPRLAGKIWIGAEAGGPGTRVFARTLGARDVALGATLLSTSTTDLRAASALARLGVYADIADAVATILAVRNLEGHRRWLMPLIATAVAAAGAVVWTVAEAEEAPSSVR